jgi:hypothetical protein
MHQGPEDIMLTKPIQSILLFVIIGFLAASCISTGLSPIDAAFNKIIPLAGMNSKLEFIALDSKEDPYRIGKSISLGLKNLSESMIIFPSDYGLQLFNYRDGQWEKIDNMAQYIPEGNRQISPKGPDTPGQTAIGFYPDLKNEGSQSKFGWLSRGLFMRVTHPQMNKQVRISTSRYSRNNA